jgi:hypothetical protein
VFGEENLIPRFARDDKKALFQQPAQAVAFEFFFREEKTRQAEARPISAGPKILFYSPGLGLWPF